MQTKQELLAENTELRARLEEAEDTLRAIRQGEVDALVVSGPQGDQVYTLKGADHPYRILVETINEGTATVLAPDGTIVYANRILAEMLKIPLERFIGSSFHYYVPQPERDWFEALLSKGKKGASKGEIRLQATDSATVPVYLSINSMQLENVPDAVCLAVTDLTEQKRQEEILAEGRLSRAILEQAEHVIVVCDADGLITQTSRAALELYDGNPLLQRFEEAFPLSIVTNGSDSNLPFAQAFSLAALQRGEIFRGVEATFKCKAGRMFHVLLDAGPLYGDNSVLRGYIVSLTDITARKQQEVERQRMFTEQQALTEELQVTNEELQSQAEELTVQKEELEKLNHYLSSQQRLLEAANEELESFSYSVSHDLKAPIRAVQGFSRMLLEEHSAQLDQESLRLLNVVVDNTKLMEKLTDDLLELSRLGRQPVRKSIINLALVTSQVFEKLRAQEPKRDLQLNIGDLPPCRCDTSLFYQVMENLLSNSIKFTKFKKTGIIEVNGRTEGREDIYSVKDNGAGFDEAYADKLFRPFQRLHLQRDYEGTGVGLAIVKRIVQKHGGRVWAEGKINEGATFYFALPKNGE
ncbi:MAG: PAS domain-containing sensor histidine kinase [Deltaproteobacteria bacterium]|nr:MAG: PAS domain-containing sensor histidine kinase [Deltaproteobacteria bacterium]